MTKRTRLRKSICRKCLDLNQKNPLSYLAAVGRGARLTEPTILTGTRIKVHTIPVCITKCQILTCWCFTAFTTPSGIANAITRKGARATIRAIGNARWYIVG